MFFCAFYALFPFFLKLTFKFDCIIDCVIPLPGLVLPRCAFHPSRILIRRIKKKARFNFLPAIFTFSALKFVKVFCTHWLYSSLTSGLLSFHIRLFAMWLLADFNLVRSLKSPTNSLYWVFILHHLCF